MRIPDNINKIVDDCFAAGIAFDLAITIQGLPFRIVSVDEGRALLRNQFGQTVGHFEKD